MRYLSIELVLSAQRRSPRLRSMFLHGSHSGVQFVQLLQRTGTRNNTPTPDIEGFGLGSNDSFFAGPHGIWKDVRETPLPPPPKRII